MNKVRINNVSKHKDSQGEHLICNGILKLVFDKDEKCQYFPRMNSRHFLPIIISETENISDGDNAYDSVYQRIVKVESINKNFVKLTSKDEGLNHSHINNLQKILCLRENFSPQHLQAIIDGKLNDNDSIILECYRRGRNSQNVDADLTGGILIDKNDYYCLRFVDNCFQTIFELKGDWGVIDAKFQKYWSDAIDGDFSMFNKGEKAISYLKYLKRNYNPPTEKIKL